MNTPKTSTQYHACKLGECGQKLETQSKPQTREHSPLPGLPPYTRNTLADATRAVFCRSLDGYIIAEEPLQELHDEATHAVDRCIKLERELEQVKADLNHTITSNNAEIFKLIAERDKIIQQLEMSVTRTRIVAGMDNNQVRRDAKLEILRLVETDINATIKHVTKGEENAAITKAGGNL